MILGAKSNKEGDANGSTRYGRLAELLSFDPCSLADNGLETGVGVALHPPACAEPAAVQEPTAAPEVQAVQPAGATCADAPPQDAQSPSGLSEPSMDHIRRAAKQIAESLVGAVAETAGDAYRRSQIDRSRLDAAMESVQRIKGDIGRANAELSVLHQVTDQISETGQKQNSRVSALEERMLSAEASARQAQQELESLLRGYTTASEQLRASQTRFSELEERIAAGLQRLGAAERAVNTLSLEVEQRAAMWERFMGSLRTLDLRSGKRYTVKEPVQVVVAGDPGTTVKGHIANISDNGIGLVLEAPVAVGSGIRIEVDGTRLEGTVRHARAHKEGHSVGVALNEPLKLPVAGAH